jgi:uncharacterized protein (DUF488 family)
MGRDENMAQCLKFYGFLPYKFGPYSFELYHDLQMLERDGLIGTDGNQIIYNHGDGALSIGMKKIIDAHLLGVASFTDSNLVDFIYDRYPEYSIFSKLKRKMTYVKDRTGIMTVGYEGQSIDEFLKRLIDEKIHALVDVRDNPWSMKYGFKRYQLETYCNKMNIDYISIPSLGVPENIRNELKETGNYTIFFRTYNELLLDRAGDIQYLNDLSRNKRIALMCFEHDPERCHRSALGKELARRGAEVVIR